MKLYNVDVLMCQETSVNEDTFNLFDYIKTSFTIISNNAHNEFGTCCIVRNKLKIGDVVFDTEGRIIIFNVGDFTLANVYLPSGTDSTSRTKREQILAETLPNLLINKKRDGVLFGDWNCIANKEESLLHPEVKMSPSLRHLVKVLNLKDSFKCVITIV